MYSKSILGSKLIHYGLFFVIIITVILKVESGINCCRNKTEDIHLTSVQWADCCFDEFKDRPTINRAEVKLYLSDIVALTVTEEKLDQIVDAFTERYHTYRAYRVQQCFQEIINQKITDANGITGLFGEDHDCFPFQDELVEKLKKHLALNVTTLQYHIHKIIFRYLNLHERGIYSGLSKKCNPRLRKTYRLEIAEALRFGLSPIFRKIEQQAFYIHHRVNIKEIKSLNNRSFALKTNLNDFYKNVELLMKPEANYTSEEHDIMSYIKLLKQDKKSIHYITFQHSIIFDRIHPREKLVRIVTEKDTGRKYRNEFWVYNIKKQKF